MKLLIALTLAFLLIGCSKEKEKLPPMPESTAKLLASKGESCGNDRNSWTWEQGGFPKYNTVEFECRDGKWVVATIRLRNPPPDLAEAIIDVIHHVEAGDSVKPKVADSGSVTTWGFGLQCKGGECSYGDAMSASTGTTATTIPDYVIGTDGKRYCSRDDVTTEGPCQWDTK